MKSSIVDVLPHVNELKPVGTDDQSCIRELRDVLKKYGALGRFGLVLLHRHFEVDESEVLVEYCDEENRTLTIRPEKLEVIGDVPKLGTNWQLGDDNSAEVVMYCHQVCLPTRDGHSRDHTYTR